MPDRDLPTGTAPDTSAQSFDDIVEDISNLINDPETDPEDEDRSHEAADDPESPDEAEDVEDSKDPDESEEKDGPQDDYAGGRFAADNAKVRLDDGRVISVADLKTHVDRRTKELQRGVTEKFQELSAQRTKVDQQAQSLDQSLEYLTWYVQNTLPKQPEMFQGNPQSDPVGYMTYMQQKDAWERAQSMLQWFGQQQQQLADQKAQEARQTRDERLRSELDNLAAKDPLFRDRPKAAQWFDRAVRTFGERYGFNQQEMHGALTDHRLVLVMRDAERFHAQKAKAATVREDVKKPVQAGGARPNPGVKVSKEKQARSEQLRKTGSFNDGVAALMDFDL